MLIFILVGGFNLPSEKDDFVSWDDDIPNWMEKSSIKFMFQTTNQWLLTIINHH